MTNVLWTLGLSWWKNVIPLLDEELELKGDNLRRFRDQVANAIQQLPPTEQLLENRVVVDSTGENRLENWHRHYVEKRGELLAFLDRAMENQSSVICSL